jgi:hypothetical protein
MADIEQPGLGGVGIDGITIGLSWGWEVGWTASVAHRLSGGDRWERRVYLGRDEAELHALLSDELAGMLGLV